MDALTLFHVAAGSAALLAVLLANPLGTRDWLIQAATDQAQHKVDRAMQIVFDQYEKNFPVSVTPPQHDQPTVAPRRQP